MVNDRNAVFEIEFEVRDYECDLQGIVNNAVYQHYLEHARHCHLRSLGLDFKAMHERDINPVVSRIEIDYRKSLTSGDRFSVETEVSMEGKLRVVFHQTIRRLPGRELVVEARVIGTVLHNGRPVPPPPELLEAMAP